MKKNIAIVGYGGQGAWHASLAGRSDFILLSGVYDIRECRMEAARADGIHTYADMAEMLADDAVDIIVCATPNDSHKDIVIAAMRAGKHVICEKPVAMSVAELDEMLKCERECGVLLGVHQNRRCDVDFLAVKSIVDSGEIGEVLNIESRVHGSRGIPSDWRCNKSQGGGMIFDWGVHLIDQVLLLIPEKVKYVWCEATHITNNEVDDGFHLHLTFESGKRATVEVGTYNFIPMPRFYMQCKSGTAYIDDWRNKCRVARLKAWCEKEVIPVQTAAGITKTMAPRDEITIESYELDRPAFDTQAFYRNFVAAVDGKEERLIKNCEVRRVMQIIEACFLSAESKRVLEVDI